MNKKILAVLLSGAMAATMLVGCGGSPSSKTDTDASTEAKGDASQEKLKIGYTVQSMENAYFVSIIEGMKAAAKEKDIDLIVSDAAGDASKHVNQIEDFISQSVDAIIISPVDEKAPEDAVKKAEEAGIPVISFCQKVEGSSAFYGTSEKEYGLEGGKIAGEWLNEKEEDGSIEDVLNDKGQIEVVVARYDVVTSVIDRGDGLKKGLEETYTGGKELVYVYEQDAADAESGYQLAETALAANPKASIFLGINDSAALGIYEAVMAKKEHTPENTCITGLDALPEALKLISEDTMYTGTVDIQPVKQGAKVLDIVEQVLADGPIEEQIVVEMKSVTKENIGDYDVE